METPKQVDILKLSDIEIKALIVDESDIIQLSTLNIQVLRAELRKRNAVNVNSNGKDKEIKGVIDSRNG